ncbi:MAG: hypothetical protein HY720_13425 [Planctomycetes bacterium]|nr:hypothetical protein [Planctomycetota bacterium]
MRKTIAALLALAVLAGAASAQTAKDLWPIDQQGNTWTYEVAPPNGTPYKTDVKVVATSGGWSKIEGFLGTRWWWTSGQSGRVWTWDATAGKHVLAFDLRTRQGGTFKVNVPGQSCLDGTTWTVKNSNLTVDTPVGTFEHCVYIVMTSPVCRAAPLGELVFAPNVGIVRYFWQSGNLGPDKWSVLYANVNGTEYKMKETPAALKGLSACISIDKYTYSLTTTRNMPPLPPGTRKLPDTLVVRFEVKNETQETISYELRSSQQYDFVIRDESGKQLWIWSANKRFMQLVQTKELKPGESIVFTESIVLSDLTGTPLPEGRYTVEGIHTTYPNSLRASGTAAFVVKAIFAS